MQAGDTVSNMHYSTRDRRWLKVAQRYANQSVERNKHGAVLVKGGSLVSWGWNRNILDPYYYANEPKLSIHAEEDAINRLVRIARGPNVDSNGAFARINKYTLYVVRVNYRGELVISAPCGRCSELLSGLGLHRVVHS